MCELARKDDALLTRTADIVFAGVDGAASLDHLRRPRQVFAIIYSAQGIIDNGGFQYLFESDWPNHPPYTFFSDAYREIGAPDVADGLDQAASMFPFSNPHLHREARVRYLRDFCVKGDSPMGVLSGEAIDASVRVFTRLAEYVRAHQNDFRKG